MCHSLSSCRTCSLLCKRKKADCNPNFPNVQLPGAPLFDSDMQMDQVLVPPGSGLSIPPYEGSLGGLLVNAYPPPSENRPLYATYDAHFGTVGNCPNRADTAMAALKAELEGLGGTVSDTFVLYGGCCEKTYAISWNNYPAGQNA